MRNKVVKTIGMIAVVLIFLCNWRPSIKAYAEEQDEFLIVDEDFMNVTIYGYETPVLKKYNGPGGEVVIPAGIKSIGIDAFFWRKDITSVIIPEGTKIIGADAFNGCENLKSISFPEGIEVIGERAFYDCTGLTEVTLPDSLKTMQGQTFYHCTGLTRIVIPDSVDYMGGSDFEECINLTHVSLGKGLEYITPRLFYGCTSLSDVNIPEDVTSIGMEAFYECSSLTDITFPAGLEYIGYEAFYGCVGLTEVEFPDGLLEIGGGAFENCVGLTEAEVPASVYWLASHVFDGCERMTKIIIWSDIASSLYGVNAFLGLPTRQHVVLYGRPGTKLEAFAIEHEVPFVAIDVEEFVIDTQGVLKKYNGTRTKVVVPNNVTAIGNGAFANNLQMKEIILPKNIQSIGAYSFYACEVLESIVIPNSVQKVDRGAFVGCVALKTAVLPDKITTIEMDTFNSCSSLMKIKIPEGVTVIKDAAFYGCERLEEIQLPDSLKTVGEYKTFSTGSFLKQMVFPKNVSVISGMPFDYGESLKRLIFLNDDITIPENLFGGFFPKDLVIYGHKGSKMEGSAYANGIPFIPIESISDVALVGSNVDLSDVINLNFYYDIDKSEINLARVRAKITYSDGRTEEKCFSEDFYQEYNGAKYYGITCMLAAKEINDDISIQLWDTFMEKPCSEVKVYSVKDYCNDLRKTLTETTPELKLVEEILTYATFSQIYFEHNQAQLPMNIKDCKLSSMAEVQAAISENAALTMEGKLPGGIEFYGCSLVLNSSIEYRIYFKADTPLLAAQCGLISGDRPGLYYFEDVTSSIIELGKQKEFHIGEATICSNPLYFIKLVAEGSHEDKLSNLTIAIYDYYKAAMECYAYYNNREAMGNETEIVGH